MLISLLVALTSTRASPILGTLARPLQAWFLQQITVVRPELASSLHDNTGVKPFTVSTLLDDRGRPLTTGSWLQPGREYWARITAFQPDLSEIILEKVFDSRNRRLPTSLELYKMPFRLDGWTLNAAQHPWAGQASYAALVKNGHSPVARRVRLEFVSPTAFRSQSADIPLPLPEHVFRSYWLKWNAFAPDLAIDDNWPGFAADCIRISELSGVNTVRWVFAEGSHGAAIGFTGVASFTLLPAHQCGAWSPYWDGAANVLHTLSSFAFYCGTGHHATTGMGQTRLAALGGERRAALAEDEE